MNVHSIERSERAREDADLAEAARRGDRALFTAIAERYRHEIRAYCYRMLGSLDDAEDLVQETLLRAWRNRETFEGRSSLRTWLYRIATNGCLDFLGSARHRVLSRDDAPPAADGRAAPPHVPWLEPYPDSLLEPEGEEPGSAGPEAAAVARESIELAFLVAVQYLPAKQRAALILCDALDWSAREASDLLGMSVPAVNSALQRARVTLEERRPAHVDRRGEPAADAEQRKLVERYVLAHEERDIGALTALLHEDLRFSMPPTPDTYVGRAKIVSAWVSGGLGSAEFGELRCVVTRSNGMPAVAIYRKQPGRDRYRPFALDVLEIEGDVVREVTTFVLDDVRAWFGLPEELS